MISILCFGCRKSNQKFPRCTRPVFGRGRIFAGALVLLGSLGSRAEAPVTQTKTEPQKVRQAVETYLQAWKTGDSATMYALWDRKTRARATAVQFDQAMKTDLRGTPEGEQCLRAFGTEIIVGGRIADWCGVRVKVQDADHATADYLADTTWDSTTGLPTEVFLPAFLDEMKNATNSETKRMMAIGIMALTDGHTDTAKKNEVTHSWNMGTSPIFTFSPRRFHLVKEEGEWHIADAVEIREMA